MPEIFEGLISDFHGFALENSKDFNPRSDDSNIKNFFDDDFGEERQAFRKSPPPFRKTRRRRRKSARRIEPVGFGGMTGGF